MNRLDLNNMFSLRAGVINQSLVGNIYKPYINYTWSPVTTALDGTAESKNKGTSGVNLKYYSGNPLDFQGSQSIPIDDIDTSLVKSISFVFNGYSTADPQSEIISKSDGRTRIMVKDNKIQIDFRDSGGSADVFVTTPLSDGDTITLIMNNNTCTSYVNGVVNTTVNQPFGGTILNLIGSGNYGRYIDGQIDYLTISNSVLSQEQITKQYTNPNQFYKDMVADGNTLFATDFRGNDGYISDDVNRSVGSELVDNTNNVISTASAISDRTGDTYRVTGNASTYAYMRLSSTGNGGAYTEDLVDGDVVCVSFKLTSFSGVYEVSFPSGLNTVLEDGTHSIIYTHNGVNTLYGRLSCKADNTEFTIEDISSFKLSGVYPITNYSPTMRTNFTQEPTGLQDLQRSFDSNGFFLDNVDYLNGNGKGYVDTQWIPPHDSDWSIELVESTLGGDTFEFNGNSFTDGILFGKDVLDNQYGVRLFNSNKIVNVSVPDFVHVVISYSSVNNNFNLFIDGVITNSDVATNVTSPVQLSVWLGSRQGSFPLYHPIKLFDVTPSALGKEEVTKAYNKALAEGLLT